MIDNIVLLITGALHQRPISELMPKCHPLGNFEQIEAINVASSSVELYNAVLVDTPLGKDSWYLFVSKLNILFTVQQLISLENVLVSRIWMN